MSHRLCVAPMMDVTDKHCRYFHRLITPNSRLYSEMIHANAVLKGDRVKLLEFDARESPLALQLGGSDPKLLGEASKIASEIGYEEINLNCGCPSNRVISGNFGVSLMESPKIVADCVGEMIESSGRLVTVKHRLAINDNENYDFTRNFVETVENAGCKVFIVHARNAFLGGLSPKKNRTVPPLKMHFVHQLKKDFPNSKFIANGGLTSLQECINLLTSEKSTNFKNPVDGVMLGREVIKNPWILAKLDKVLFSGNSNLPNSPELIIDELQRYFEKQIKIGYRPTQITKQWSYLFKNCPGSKIWRHNLARGLSPVEAYKIGR